MAVFFIYYQQEKSYIVKNKTIKKSIYFKIKAHEQKTKIWYKIPVYVK